MRWNVCLTGGADHESNFIGMQARGIARIFPSTTGPSRFRATYRDKTNSEGVMDAETVKRLKQGRLNCMHMC